MTPGGLNIPNLQFLAWIKNYRVRPLVQQVFKSPDTIERGLRGPPSQSKLA